MIVNPHKTIVETRLSATEVLKSTLSPNWRIRKLIIAYDKQ